MDQQGPTVWPRELCSVLSGGEASLGENGCMYMHGWVPSLSTWNRHNTVGSSAVPQYKIKSIKNKKNSTGIERTAKPHEAPEPLSAKGATARNTGMLQEAQDTAGTEVWKRDKRILSNPEVCSVFLAIVYKSSSCKFPNSSKDCLCVG